MQGYLLAVGKGPENVWGFSIKNAEVFVVLSRREQARLFVKHSGNQRCC